MLAALVAMAVVTSAALGVLTFVREWRPPGGGSGENPLASDRAGTAVYLAQPNMGPTGRVVRFDQNGNVVRVLDAGGGVDIQSPFGLAVDSAGRLYVFDSARGRVAVVDPAGGVLRTIAPTRDDAFDAFPSTLAVDGQDNLYVADTRRSRILVFGAGTDQVIRRIPLGGSFVSGVAVDAAGNVYAHMIAGDAGCTTRVQKHAPSGALLTQWAVSAPPAYICSRSIAVDPSTGEVLVSSPGGTQPGVRRYTADGAPVGTPILGNGRPGDVLRASGLAVAANGTLEVVDSDGNRILRFEDRTATPAPPAGPPPPPPVDLSRTIPSPQTVTAGPTSAIAPGQISLGALTRSRCIRVVVRSSRPARVLVTIFSGRRSIRLFGQKDVLFRAPGRRVVCITVPRRARTFNVRTPLRFALGYRLGTVPELLRPAVGRPRTRPAIRPIRLVP